jgi:hypothetical protein
VEVGAFFGQETRIELGLILMDCGSLVVRVVSSSRSSMYA